VFPRLCVSFSYARPKGLSEFLSFFVVDFFFSRSFFFLARFRFIWITIFPAEQPFFFVGGGISFIESSPLSFTDTFGPKASPCHWFFPLLLLLPIIRTSGRGQCISNDLLFPYFSCQFFLRALIPVITVFLIYPDPFLYPLRPGAFRLLWLRPPPFFRSLPLS